MNVWVLPLAISGFAVSWYIYYKKKRNEKLVCIIGEDCDKVVRSKYGSLLGVSNEVLGMGYYGLVAVLSGIILTGTGTILSFPLFTFLLIIGGGAALFSIVLLFIQSFILEELCEYCIVSAAASIIIFVVELLAV